MNETYTLNRFYFEAKAILEKYGLSQLENYKLKVEFTIEEKEQSNPQLDCIISWGPCHWESKEKTYYGFGVTPSICLSSLEESMRKNTGKHLIEYLAIEISPIKSN